MYETTVADLRTASRYLQDWPDLKSLERIACVLLLERILPNLRHHSGLHIEEASPPTSKAEAPMELSTPTPLLTDAPLSPRCVKVEVFRDGSCVQVSWHSAPTER